MAEKQKRNVSKRTRFEIFKRDNFTCQYCGAQPPSVVLVVDHIHPKAAEGKCDPINLITACEACNQGKSDRLLGGIHPRPDADLMYLETMQEIAEIERFKKAHEQLEQRQLEMVEMLQSIWCRLADTEWCPNDAEMLKMIRKGSLETCKEAVTLAAISYSEGRCGDKNWLRYMWGIFNRLNAEAGNE